jgi:hypothetical protein
VTDAVTDLGDLLDGPAVVELDPTEHEARHFFLAALVVMLCGILSAINGPNIKAMFLNLSPPAHRASLISWANFLNCVGRGIGTPRMSPCAAIHPFACPECGTH